jgi:predicted alpha/beta superfamily hydrolase
MVHLFALDTIVSEKNKKSHLKKYISQTNDERRKKMISIQSVNHNEDSFDLHSKEGVSYQISVYVPDTAPPQQGFPVLYVLDGNAFFRTFRDAVRLQARRSSKTNVLPMIVVGIGDARREDFVSERRCYDFTPPSSSLKLPKKPNGEPWSETGGANTFLAFLEETLKPQILEHYPIDTKNEALFGHSLGGLFALYSLYTKPSLFSAYIASSPSLWWNERAILAKEEEFRKNLHNETLHKKLFVSIGSEEKGHMVTDAQDLAKRFSAINSSSFSFSFVEAKGENHMSVVLAVLSQSLRFISLRT